MKDAWWTSDTEDHRAVEEARDIRGRQSERDDDLLAAICLFDDYPSLGFTPHQYAVRRVANRSRQYPNVVRSCATTVQAEVIQVRPQPQFLTSDGDWSIRRKARKLTQFVEGVFEENTFHRLASRVALDAIVFGTGIIRGFVDEGTKRVKFERVYPWEYWVDERDGYYDNPRSHYIQRFVDRSTLKALYPKSADKIDSAPCDSNGWRYRETIADQVLVVEAWHLPSGPDAGDGRHVIAIQGHTLFREAWEEDWVPLLKLRWRDPLQGYWSQGLAMELDGYQTAINKLIKTIEVGQHYNAFPRLAIERNSRVTRAHLTNEPATAFEYTGTKPDALQFNAVNGEIYQYLNQLISWAYEMSGINALSARAEVPAGFKSGKAQLVHADLQSRRMMDFQRAFEGLHVDGARLSVRLMEHAAASNDNKGYDVVYRHRHRVERIAWRDARLDESTYILHAASASALPKSPAGRFEAVMDMLNSGFAAQVGLPPQEILRLMDFPDLDAATRRITDAVDLVEQVLDRMLETGIYRAPLEFWDLNLCILLGARTYQQWTLEGVDEELLDLLAQWIDEARALRDEAAAAAAAPAPGPAAMPAAAGPALPPDAVPPEVAAAMPEAA